MRIIDWKRPSRKFSNQEVDDFYNRCLDQPTLFRFRTRLTELPEHGGHLSLKMVLSGEEEYQFERQAVTLRPGQFLVINQGQHYASRVLQETESISMFFPEDDHTGIVQAALDANEPLNSQAVLPQLPFTADKYALNAQGSLVHSLNKGTTPDSDAAARMLMIHAIRNLHHVVPFTNLKSATKPTTRNELIRRLMRAKAHIDDTHGRIADIDTLAETACLSKYYFLRLFSELFSTSPATYARKIRLSRAMEDIRKGETPRRAARKAGYCDFRAFRRACKRNLGFDPQQNSQFQTTLHC